MDGTAGLEQCETQRDHAGQDGVRGQLRRADRVDLVNRRIHAWCWDAWQRAWKARHADVVNDDRRESRLTAASKTLDFPASGNRQIRKRSAGKPATTKKQVVVRLLETAWLGHAP